MRILKNAITDILELKRDFRRSDSRSQRFLLPNKIGTILFSSLSPTICDDSRRPTIFSTEPANLFLWNVVSYEFPKSETVKKTRFRTPNIHFHSVEKKHPIASMHKTEPPISHTRIRLRHLNIVWREMYTGIFRKILTSRKRVDWRWVCRFRVLGSIRFGNVSLHNRFLIG